MTVPPEPLETVLTTEPFRTRLRVTLAGTPETVNAGLWLLVMLLPIVPGPGWNTGAAGAGALVTICTVTAVLVARLPTVSICCNVY